MFCLKSMAISSLAALSFGHVVQVVDYQKTLSLTQGPTNQDYENVTKNAYKMGVGLNSILESNQAYKNNFSVDKNVKSLIYSFSNHADFNYNDHLFNTSYRGKTEQTQILTFELPNNLNINDYPIITFGHRLDLKYMPKDNQGYTKSSWGGRSYSGDGPKKWFNKKDITQIGIVDRLITSWNDVPFNKSRNLSIKWDSDFAADLSIQQSVAFSSFNYKGSSYLQLIINHYGETWNSGTGGGIWTSWGSGFGLWSKSQLNILNLWN